MHEERQGFSAAGTLQLPLPKRQGCLFDITQVGQFSIDASPSYVPAARQYDRITITRCHDTVTYSIIQSQSWSKQKAKYESCQTHGGSTRHERLQYLRPQSGHDLLGAQHPWWREPLSLIAHSLDHCREHHQTISLSRPCIVELEAARLREQQECELSCTFQDAFKVAPTSGCVDTWMNEWIEDWFCCCKCLCNRSVARIVLAGLLSVLLLKEGT